MDRDAALKLAEEFLRKAYPKSPPTIVMQPELSKEHGWAWSVRFSTREWLEGGDARFHPMVTRLVVPKDGSRVRFMPSAFTSSEQEEYLSSGRRPER